MRSHFHPGTMLFCALLYTLILVPSSVTCQTIPRPDHVVIVIEENHSYSEII